MSFVAYRGKDPRETLFLCGELHIALPQNCVARDLGNKFALAQMRRRLFQPWSTLSTARLESPCISSRKYTPYGMPAAPRRSSSYSNTIYQYSGARWGERWLFRIPAESIFFKRNLVAVVQNVTTGAFFFLSRESRRCGLLMMIQFTIPECQAGIEAEMEGLIFLRPRHGHVVSSKWRGRKYDEKKKETRNKGVKRILGTHPVPHIMFPCRHAIPSARWVLVVHMQVTNTSHTLC